MPALPGHVAVHAIPDLGRRLGDLADRFFRKPSADLQVAGITGTNGKTTSAYLLAQAADLVGRQGAYLGTIGFGRPGALRDAGLTTPDCVSVHRRLAQARDAGAKTMSVEVSSHALDQGRVAGVRFDTEVFTNLTRDHLDYHGTLEAYGEAKASLFRTPGLRRRSSTCATGIPWTTWVRWLMPLFVLWVIIGGVALLVAHAIQWGPF